MHDSNKFFYGLWFISIFSSDLTNAIDALESAPKNETIVTTTNIQNNTVSKPIEIAAEGGTLPQTIEHDDTHLGRERVIEKLSELPKAFNKTSNETLPLAVDNPMNKTQPLVENPTLKPVIENSQEIDLGVPKKNDNKKIVGKKGVTDYDTISTVTNTSAKVNVTTTTNSTVNQKIILTTIPKKPKVTEYDDAAVAPSEAKLNKSDARTPKIPNLDTIFEKNSNRADYVIPIVAVILSVPLVAIIISVLYKRGTDWWQHRNYRRMDFLIDGMYNN